MEAKHISLFFLFKIPKSLKKITDMVLNIKNNFECMGNL
jgi:hypothetical protein